MKYSVYILLLFFAEFSNGQTFVHQGGQNKILVNPGGSRVDSVLYIPVRGDSAWEGHYGNVRINVASGNFEFRKNGDWIEPAPRYKIQEFSGAPVYKLQHIPIDSTVTVRYNGQDLSQKDITVNNSIISLMFSVNISDAIKITYFYNE